MCTWYISRPFCARTFQNIGKDQASLWSWLSELSAHRWDCTPVTDSWNMLLTHNEVNDSFATNSSPSEAIILFVEKSLQCWKRTIKLKPNILLKILPTRKWCTKLALKAKVVLFFCYRQLTWWCSTEMKSFRALKITVEGRHQACPAIK